MHILLLPLSGAFLVIHLALLGVKVWALGDAAVRPEPAFRAADKKSKSFWLLLLAVALLTEFLGFLTLVGLVAAIVYLVDVRPAVREFRRGSSQQTGPYGPW